MAFRTGRLEELRRRRDLGGGSRSGRYARGQAWERVLPFMRRFWWMLPAFPVAFLLAFLPMVFLTHGMVRGIVVGGAIASGLWCDVLVVVVWTGAATMFMGASGEASTAEILHQLRRQGWRLINGLKRNSSSDIDHVVIGPGGVLVVESKWSGDPWPLNGYGPKSMESRLKNAALQAASNAKEIASWLDGSVPNVPVSSLAVLWSGASKSGSGWGMGRDGHTILVHGPDLRRWLRTELPQTGLDSEGVERVWSLLALRIDQQDRAAADAGEVTPPTLWSLVRDWTIKPAVGLLVAGYALWLTRFIDGWPIVFAATLVAFGLGLWAHRFNPIRQFAVGWIVTSTVYLFAEIIILVGTAIR
jgi:hypothetical protein